MHLPAASSRHALRRVARVAARARAVVGIAAAMRDVAVLPPRSPDPGRS